MKEWMKYSQYNDKQYLFEKRFINSGSRYACSISKQLMSIPTTHDWPWDMEHKPKYRIL